MKKLVNQFMSVIVVIVLTLLSYYGVYALPETQGQTIYYVSPTGNDGNNGSYTSPFRTIQKATNKTIAGDVIVLLGGSYTGSITVTETGTQDAPVTIRGEGARFDGGSLILKNSQWLVLESLAFYGGTNQVTLQNSHFITFHKNVFDFKTRGIYIQDYSSHILIEGNEFYQSCTVGKTWTQLKGSDCEGGAVYGSSYGGGTYHIRGNWVHDAFNGFIFSDDSEGLWMNSNVFIYDNRFDRIIDDPAEPEGDSFNFHVFGNTMTDTHRMVSLTTNGLGPVFVYNNVQITTGNPTGESSRLNSAFKIDLSDGFSNGVYIFNNTIVGENAANFYAYDMLSRFISSPLLIRNNVYVTNLKAFSSSPSGGSIDFDISKSNFGMTQPNGILGDPLLLPDGQLSKNSMAIGKSVQILIPIYFSVSKVIASGANLGAFQTIPVPAWSQPPNYPSQIPANVAGWPSSPVSVTAMPQPTNTTSPMPVSPTATAMLETPTSLPLPTNTPTSTFIAIPSEIATSVPLSPTPQAPIDTIEPTDTTDPMPPSETVYDDMNPAFAYSPDWTDVSKKKAYNGSYKQTSQNDAFVTFTFTGQSFSILYTTGPAFRDMEVYIDDVLVGRIDQRAEKAFQQRWDYSGQLEPGPHILKLVFDTKNKGNKTKGGFDAVIVR